MRNAKRRSVRVTSKTFCGMLAKFSMLPIGATVEPAAAPVRSRRENLVAAILRGTHTDAEWHAQCSAQGGKCYYCGRESREVQPRMIQGKLRHLTLPLEKDHKTPIGRGGSDGIDNLVGACMQCNRSKGSLTAEEFMEARRGE